MEVLLELPPEKVDSHLPVQNTVSTSLNLRQNGLEFSEMINFSGDDNKKTRFTEAQIVSILKEVDAGLKVEDICRKHAGLAPTLYRKRFGRRTAIV